jgi:hypothetical protein
MVDTFFHFFSVVCVVTGFEDGFSNSSDLSFFVKIVFYVAIIPHAKTYWNGLYESPCEGRSFIPVFRVISLGGAAEPQHPGKLLVCAFHAGQL